MTVKVKSVTAQRALASMGENIRVARLKRRISVKGFAERMGVSESTVARLEKGDGGVRIGTLAMACLVLGEIHRVSEFLDIATDDTGLLLDRASLPKRINRNRRSGPVAARNHEIESVQQADDEEGIGF